MAQIKITNLTFSYDGSYTDIFENVSLNLDTSWRLGFTGRNGRGKTTFLKLLMGEYEYSGTISSPVEFTYFPPEIKDPDSFTNEVVSELRPDAADWMLLREMNLLEVGEDVLWRPFSTLSEGERTKMLLAAMFSGENNFLLIDEPTNHLDLHGRELVAQYLRSKSGFILVSHDRRFLDSCVDHVLSINKTNIEVMSGNFTDWLREKDRRDREEIAENEKLKKEISRLKKTAREKSEWADRAESTKIGFDPTKVEKSMGRRSYIGAKSKKMNKRASAIEERTSRAIEEKSELLKNIEESEALKLHTLDYHSVALGYLKNVSVSYGEKPVCSGVSFDIKAEDRILLRGRNGSGKSSILKLILGEEIPHTGEFYLGNGVKISYVPQDVSHLSGDLSGFADEHEIDESLFKAILRKMDFSREQFDVPIEKMSMGQKKKVLIAKSLSERAHLLIWDEPLNYIDVLSRIQLEELIPAFSPTMIFVEHDADFAEKISTKIVEL